MYEDLKGCTRFDGLPNLGETGRSLLDLFFEAAEKLYYFGKCWSF
jgi:hypothetical protein